MTIAYPDHFMLELVKKKPVSKRDPDHFMLKLVKRKPVSKREYTWLTRGPRGPVSLYSHKAKIKSPNSPHPGGHVFYQPPGLKGIL